jgi:hypothetical protein
MPRRYYRRRRNSSERRREGDATILLVILAVAIILLLLVLNGRVFTTPIPRIELPDIHLPVISTIQIPITGLPKVIIPTMQIQIPITVVPGTLMPNIGIEGSPVPPGVSLGPQTKTSGCVINNNLPDAACTPGAAMNSSTSQICTVGYSESVRNVSEDQKNQIYAEYGIANHVAGQYEVDHLVPLELGGSNDNANLWPQPASPTPGFPQKDALENYLHDQVCAGKLSLADAQRQIASNWVAAYNAMPK